MARFVYADNSATTPVSPSVAAAMAPCFTTLYGNPSSIYSVGREAKKALEDSRVAVARCLGASPEEIYFTSGGSDWFEENQSSGGGSSSGSGSGGSGTDIPTFTEKDS